MAWLRPFNDTPAQKKSKVKKIILANNTYDRSYSGRQHGNFQFFNTYRVTKYNERGRLNRSRKFNCASENFFTKRAKLFRSNGPRQLQRGAKNLQALKKRI